jgi:hypothetical protein
MSNAMNEVTVEQGLQNVHLVSGEDVIGKVHFSPQDLMYTIERPVMPNIQMDPSTGALRVGLLVPVSDRMAEIYQRYTSEIELVQPETLKTILQS